MLSAAPEHLEGTQAWASSDDATLLILSPAGHFSFIEKPDEFFPAVDVFLDEEPVTAGG